MKFSKYSEDSARIITIGTSSSSSDSTDNTNTISRVERVVNRKLWGNQDNGSSSINDTIKAVGDIYAYDYNDDNDSPTTSRYTFPDEGGQIYAEKMVYSPTVYATEHLCINHPQTGNKTDIIDLMGDYNSRITANATSITTLQSALTALNTTVSGHTTSIGNNQTNINANANEIEALKARIAALEASAGSGSSGESGGSSTAVADFPVGTIIMFNAISTTFIPKGWHICDGTKGTPNLIGKFVRASRTSGTVGGNDSITLKRSDIPEMVLWRAGSTVTSDSVSSFVPKFSYGSQGSGYAESTEGLSVEEVTYSDMINDVLGCGRVGTKAENQTSIDITPSYYSLIFIMRVKDDETPFTPEDEFEETH